MTFRHGDIVRLKIKFTPEIGYIRATCLDSSSIYVPTIGEFCVYNKHLDLVIPALSAKVKVV